MHPQIKSVADIYAFNSTNLVHVLSDLTDEEAGFRTRDGEGNSISFLVGHLVSSRVSLLKRLGETDENPWVELYGSKARAQEGSAYPPIAEMAATWKAVAKRFEALLEGLTEEQILAPVAGYPVPDQTERGALMFMAWHESYHVGQIGMLRKEVGKQAFRERLMELAQRAS